MSLSDYTKNGESNYRDASDLLWSSTSYANSEGVTFSIDRQIDESTWEFAPVPAIWTYPPEDVLAEIPPGDVIVALPGTSADV